jgi:NTP pyrophosphatase (non-canonical NTP hydrolase)
MKELYYEKDEMRGMERTFLKLVEEVGELSEAILLDDEQKITEEIIDIIAWIYSIANLAEIDVNEEFFKKYAEECPKCTNNPCSCDSI